MRGHSKSLGDFTDSDEFSDEEPQKIAKEEVKIKVHQE